MSERLILGENAIYTMNGEINDNILVIGGSGSGKTMSLAEPYLLETYASSIVVTAVKRRIIEQYAPLLRSRGYDVLDLDLAHPDRSDVTYDPLAYVESTADIAHLASAIIDSDPRKAYSSADPYWDKAATDLLKALIKAVLIRRSIGISAGATFADVLWLFDELSFDDKGGGRISTSLDGFFEQLAWSDTDGCAKRWFSSFSNLPIRTAGCVYSQLATLLSEAFTQELRNMMQNSSRALDLTQLANQKTALFITISPIVSAHRVFANLLYSQLFKALFELNGSRPLPVPVKILCDDMAADGGIHGLPRILSVIREKGVSVMALLQSEGQLNECYGHSAQSIFDNCDSLVYLGGMDVRTAQHISQRLNTGLEDVLWMPVGREYIFRRGQRPVKTVRYNIQSNSLYQQLLRNYKVSQEVYGCDTLRDN